MVLGENRWGVATVLGASLCMALLGACAQGSQQVESTSEPQEATQEADTTQTTTIDSPGAVAEQGIDYQVLVNKTHRVPEGWEDAIELVHFKNSEGWDVDVDAKAYDAYLALKDDLKAEGVIIDLDSAYRSVEEQQRIWDDFTKKYGEEYVRQHVAVPGYSEHHTGLALDLFLIIKGKGVYQNEDMIKYPDIWAKVHAKIADYGFVLRYLPQKKIETGYSYEPWHIRYIDDVELAREIMDRGITYERYLGALDPAIAGCTVDYGTSKLYEESDIDSALDPVLAEFTSWKGCTLKLLAFTDDKTCTKELAKANALRDKGTKEYTQAIVLTSDFRSPPAADTFETAWLPNTDYAGWTWLLARRSSEDSWDLLTWGVG